MCTVFILKAYENAGNKYAYSGAIGTVVKIANIDKFAL